MRAKKFWQTNLLCFITFYFSWTCFFFVHFLYFHWVSFFLYSPLAFHWCAMGTLFPNNLWRFHCCAFVLIFRMCFEMRLSHSRPHFVARPHFFARPHQQKQVEHAKVKCINFYVNMFTGCGKVSIRKKSERAKALEMHILTKHLHVFVKRFIFFRFVQMNVLFKWFARAPGNQLAKVCGGKETGNAQWITMKSKLQLHLNKSLLSFRHRTMNKSQAKRSKRMASNVSRLISLHSWAHGTKKRRCWATEFEKEFK